VWISYLPKVAYFVYNKDMKLGDYIFKDSPKYYKTTCSKCGDEIEKTNKSKTIKFVCHKCKQVRNRERARKSLRKANSPI
jgi:hypothetical protein